MCRGQKRLPESSLNIVAHGGTAIAAIAKNSSFRCPEVGSKFDGQNLPPSRYLHCRMVKNSGCLRWELRTLSEEVLEGQGARLECPEAARGSQESPGRPQERLRNGAAESQKKSEN